jgi:hypothetical protein
MDWTEISRNVRLGPTEKLKGLSNARNDQAELLDMTYRERFYGNSVCLDITLFRSRLLMIASSFPYAGNRVGSIPLKHRTQIRWLPLLGMRV